MEARFETWNFQQGAPEYIQVLAQTEDWFLWIGSPAGLYRFDGVRFERFHSVSGDSLLSTNVYTLFAPSSGGLWVGYTFGGFSFVRNGRVRNYGGEIAEATGTVFQFAESPDGNLWATTGSGVWRFEGSMWRRQEIISNARGGIRTCIGFDRSGILWLIDMKALYYLLPGATRFQRAAGDIDLSTGFAQDADQKVLTRPCVQDKGLNACPIFRNGSYFQVADRNNGIWNVRFSGGVIRRPASMSLEDAVSNHDRGNSRLYSVHVQNLNSKLVDREGNVWFADENRLYRFYYSPLIKQELPNDMGPFAISVDGDANVWIACWARPDLYRVANGKTEALHAPIPETGWSLVYAAPDRTIWFGGKRFLWHLVNGKFFRVQVPAEVADHVGFLQAITPDDSGGLWFSFVRHGLYRFADGAWTLFGGRKDLPRTGVVSEFTDRLGRVWFGSTKSRLAVLDGDRVHTYGPNDGIRVGNITAIYGRGPSIWIGGEFGLQRFDNACRRQWRGHRSRNR